MHFNKLIFIYGILTISCRTSYCPENKLNADRFRKDIEYLEYFQKSGDEYLVDEYRDVLFYLSNTSKIITQADISSTFGYRSESKFQSDIEAWKKWIKQNPCKLTNTYVDSVMKSGRY